ncbi:MAG: phosphopentomutase [Deltaproteobacteria bacterium HGW-Deltaproteobacteria-4]|nr:MAG: phosphopentomutase [Deltaproteobacteria bacterium HGW-Deltaproteobacteria-4]
MPSQSVPIQRVILIVLDGVGIGALPDAASYGDSGANTLLHIAQAKGGLSLPNLQSLGLGNILHLPGIPPSLPATAHYGRMQPCASGKDSTTGHWEICGVTQLQPFSTFPHGFPAEIIAAFQEQTGLEPLGNIAASGTDVLRLFGEEHLRSGRPIIYTSVDSVLQIAAHEEIMAPERLYEICRIARKILDPYRVARVIARPFRGTAVDDFKRTRRRRDFSMLPTTPTILDDLINNRLPVYAIGKISDLFAGQGISNSVSTRNNQEGMEQTVAALKEIERGVIFTNLIDFDMEFGHRLDVAGFARALERFDSDLALLLAALSPTDLLIITADHGCDPTTAGSDHSREYVPLLVWQSGMTAGRDLGTRATFADIAATIATIFFLPLRNGTPLVLE